MTHIPVGTKLKITEFVPLPIPRPEVPKDTPFVPAQDWGSSTAFRMPLERPEKPADAFNGGGWYPTSLDELKGLLEPPNGLIVGSNWWKQKWNEILSFNPFSFSIAEDKHGWWNLNIYNFESELLLWVVAVSVVGAILTGIILGTEKILEYFNIISRDR